MKLIFFTKSSVVLSSFIAVFFTFVLCQASLAQTWYAQIYSKNSKYIEVTLDIRNVSSETEFIDVTVALDFYDSKGKFLEDETFLFTDFKFKSLVGGKVYKRYFLNPYPSAKLVKPKPGDTSLQYVPSRNGAGTR